MDRVRFGRALGYGARHAARTLAQAAKAAAAPSPAEHTGSASAGAGAPPVSSSAPRMPALQEAGAGVMEAQRAVSRAKGRVRSQAASAGRSVVGPLRRAGGVLWLEMTGCAFALFALFLAPGLWKMRAAWHAAPSSGEAHKFYLYLVVLVLFTYFAISSFVRANRRGKRP